MAVLVHEVQHQWNQKWVDGEILFSSFFYFVVYVLQKFGGKERGPVNGAHGKWETVNGDTTVYNKLNLDTRESLW